MEELLNKEEEKNGEEIPAPQTDEPTVENGDNTTPVELNSSPKPVDEEPTTEPTEVSEVTETTEVAEPEQGVDMTTDNHSEVITSDEGTDKIEFTPAQQNYINDLVGKTRMETRERTFKYVYDRYGVNDEAGLDEAMGNSQRFDSLNEEYGNYKKETEDTQNRLKDLAEQLALLQSGINENNYDDIKFLLKGKGMEVNLDNINTELETHPYWKKEEEKPAPVEEEVFSKLQKPQTFGNTSENSEGETERNKAMKMFGL